MLKDFWEQNKFIIQFSGFVITAGALFLNIPIPQQEQAKHFLANIQVFWLSLFVVGLIFLSISSIKFILNTERKIEDKYDIPTIGTFSVGLGLIFLWVISSLLGYISSLYATSFAQLVIIALPTFVLFLLVMLMIFLEKRKINSFIRLIANSFVLATLSSLCGIYIQQGMLKHFHYYWLYLVFPIIFIFLVVLFLIVEKVRKKQSNRRHLKS